MQSSSSSSKGSSSNSSCSSSSITIIAENTATLDEEAAVSIPPASLVSQACTQHLLVRLGYLCGICRIVDITRTVVLQKSGQCNKKEQTLCCSEQSGVFLACGLCVIVKAGGGRRREEVTK